MPSLAALQGARGKTASKLFDEIRVRGILSTMKVRLSSGLKVTTSTSGSRAPCGRAADTHELLNVTVASGTNLGQQRPDDE